MAQTTGQERISRRARQRLRHRAEILEAAEEVFSENGYHSTTMEEIARRADFSVGSIYYFFKNKEELYSEILLEKAAMVEKRLRWLMDEESGPGEKIKKYFLARLDLFWEHPRFFRLFFHETRGTVTNPGAGYTPEAVQQYYRFRSYLEGVLEEGVNAGVFRPLEIKSIVFALEGTLRAYLEYLSLEDAPRRDPDEERGLFDIFARGAML